MVMDISKTAYNSGLEIRYAIAASKIDPIQHIPEIDAIIERRLIECYREALEEAAKVAEALVWSSTETKIGDVISTERVAGKIAARKISAAIRALSVSSPTLLQEQKANDGKEGE